MAVMAVFECAHCRTQTIRGYYRGGDQYQAEFQCLPCRAKTRHTFMEYTYIDERSEAQRAKDPSRMVHNG